MNSRRVFGEIDGKDKNQYPFCPEQFPCSGDCPTMNTMENTKYCIFCGAENAADADTCRVCGKTLHPQENLLKEYLYRKTKDKLKGKAEDSFLSVIRNWILSHLYGVVVTVSLIALAAVRVSAASPSLPSYVRVTSAAGRPDHTAASSGTENNAQESPVHTGELTVTTEDLNDVSFLMYEYASRFMEADIAAHGGHVESDREEDRERASLEECVAPPSYGYSGALEYYRLQTREFLYYESTTEQGDMLVNEPTTELGKRLLADGHPVVECIATSIYTGDEGSRELSFRYVSTKLDGTWYIAEVLAQ